VCFVLWCSCSSCQLVLSQHQQVAGGWCGSTATTTSCVLLLLDAGSSTTVFLCSSDQLSVAATSCFGHQHQQVSCSSKPEVSASTSSRMLACYLLHAILPRHCHCSLSALEHEHHALTIITIVTVITWSIWHLYHHISSPSSQHHCW